MFSPEWRDAFPRVTWCFPQHDTPCFSKWVTTVLESLGEACLSTVVCLWAMNTGNFLTIRNGVVFFPGEVLVSVLRPVSLPWESRTSATSAISPCPCHTQVMGRAPKAGWEQQYWCVCCQQPAEPPGPPGWAPERQHTSGHQEIENCALALGARLKQCKIREKLQGEDAEPYISCMSSCPAPHRGQDLLAHTRRIVASQLN